jgi:hypothetical protein
MCQEQAAGEGADDREERSDGDGQADAVGALDLRQHDQAPMADDAEMAGFIQGAREIAHRLLRSTQEMVGRMVGVGEGEQPQGELIASRESILLDVAAPFEAGEHAEDLTRTASEHARQITLRQSCR